MVFPALLLAACRGGVRARRGRRLDAGRPVHRRRRARGVAPALLALLHARAQAVRLSRLRRAVHRPVHPGHGLPQDLPRCRRQLAAAGRGRRRAGRRLAGAGRRPAGQRRPLREDEQVQAQHGRSDREHRGLRRRHGAAVHALRQPAGARSGVDRGRDRRRLALPEPPVAAVRGASRPRLAPPGTPTPDRLSPGRDRAEARDPPDHRCGWPGARALPLQQGGRADPRAVEPGRGVRGRTIRRRRRCCAKRSRPWCCCSGRWCRISPRSCGSRLGHDDAARRGRLAAGGSRLAGRRIG